MIASSTKTPIAIAKPPRVIVFTVKSSALSTSMVTIKDKGIAVIEIITVRKLTRKSIRIITTIIAPSRRASTTLSMASSIKSDCLKISVCMVISVGKVVLDSARTVSIRSINSRVLASGCLLITSIIPR